MTVYAMLAIACGGGDTGPAKPVDNAPATLALSQTSALTLQSGATSTTAATVSTKDGRVLTGYAVVWTTSDPTIASVSGGTITGVKVGTATISATASTATASFSVIVTPGAPSALAIRTQATGAPVDSVFARQPAVEVRDVAGNVVTSSTTAVTAAIASGGGVLGGTASVVAVGGVATFTNLSITGSAGDRTLSFSSPGLAAVTSAPLTITPPPIPLLVADSSSITINAVTSANPANRAITITNGGGGNLSGVTIDSIGFDAGQPVGWLAASLTGTTTPFVLNVSVTSAALPIGSYHATIRVKAPGATNSPINLSVTLNVAQPTLTWGATNERVKMLDPGGSFSPALTALLNGQPAPLGTLTFVSRATSIATVDAAGKIVAVAQGQTWVVASLFGASDSVYVLVTRSAGTPVLRTDLTTYTARPGDLLVVNVILDPRSTQVGAATIVIGYEVENNMFQSVSAGVPTQTPMPVLAFASTGGVLRSSIASATALSTSPTMARLQLVVRPGAGLNGWITVTVLDMVDPTGADIALQVTSTRYPIFIR